MLAVYQIAGSVSRPVWGWIADRYLTPTSVLAIHGFGMAIAAALTGQFHSGWTSSEVFVVVLLAGCTAGGYTGVAYAEYASLGGARRTEATGLGTALMFSGGMSIPPLFGTSIAFFGDYSMTYAAMAVFALTGAVSLWWQSARA